MLLGRRGDGAQGISLAAGGLLVILGLALNERVLADIASPDGTIESALFRSCIRAFNLLFVLAGLLLLVYRRSRLATRFSRLVVYVFFLFLTCAVGLFLVLESNDTFASRLAHAGVRYYAAKITLNKMYVMDPELVWRGKPGLTVVFPRWRGDLYDSSFGVKVPPFTYRSTYDRNGFRNPITRDSADLVVMGDSFLEMGVDDEDTFAERLGRLGGLKVVNLGLSFYGPYQYLASFKRFGVGLKPRYALFFFFEGNDIEEIRKYHGWKERGAYGNLLDLPSMSLPRRFATALSDLALFVEASLRDRASRALRAEEGPGRDPDLIELRLGGKTIPMAFMHRGFIYRARPEPPDELLRMKEWRELRAILREFRQVSLENRIEPIVVFLPTKSHLYAEYTTEGSGDAWLAIRGEELAANGNAENAMARLCEEVGMRFFSLTPLFSALARQGELLYYPFDSHWNSEGREAAASALAGELGLKAGSREARDHGPGRGADFTPPSGNSRER